MNKKLKTKKWHDMWHQVNAVIYIVYTKISRYTCKYI